MAKKSSEAQGILNNMKQGIELQPGHIEKLKNLISTGQLSTEQLGDLISGKYGESGIDDDELPKIIPKDQLNEKLGDYLVKQDELHIPYELRDLIPVSAKVLNSFDPEDIEGFSKTAILGNELNSHKWSPENSYKILTNPKKHGLDPDLNKLYSNLSDEKKKKFIEERPDKYVGIEHATNDLALTPDIAKKVINKHVLKTNSLDKFLGALPEEDRNKYLDKVIGYEGHEKTNEGLAPEENFNNAYHGKYYHNKRAEAAAGSKYLQDHQADYIKREGDKKEKLALFHNQAHPKHAEEMYEKYLNDDTHHGYDREHLIEALAPEYPRDEDYEMGREEAYEEYPFSSYLQDIGVDQEEYDKMPEREQERLNEHYYESDYLSQLQSDLAQDHFEEWKQNELLHDKDVIPQHIQDTPTFQRHYEEHNREAIQREAAKKAARDAEHKEFVDSQIPQKDTEFHYGKGQHQLELAKQYADANGGSIDIGTLNKKHPNLVEDWKKTFSGKGKLTSQEIQHKIDTLPKRKYNMTFQKWDADNMQNLNHNHEVVVRLDNNPEELKHMEETNPELHETFKKIADVSQRSGHPTNPHTIAWARVDFSNPKHPMIDEVQSDFGSTARDYLKKEGHEDKAAKIQELMNHFSDWREALTNYVIKTAKVNGAEQISTHSPESKAAHTGADKVHTVYKESYEKVPRKMGFKPNSYENLPLTEEGKNTFITEKASESPEERVNRHKEAIEHHAMMAKGHELAAEEGQSHTNGKELESKHKKLIREHIERAANIDPTRRGELIAAAKEAESRDPQQLKYMARASSPEGDMHENDAMLTAPPPTTKAHQGHTLDLRPEAFKKSEEPLAKIEKIAQFLNILDKNKEVLAQLKSANPQLFDGIQKLVNSAKEAFKTHKDTDLHEDQSEHEVRHAVKEHIGTPAMPEKVTHAKPHYATGAERQYGPGQARIKTASGEWKSIAGGEAIDPLTGQRSGGA